MRPTTTQWLIWSSISVLAAALVVWLLVWPTHGDDSMPSTPAVPGDQAEAPAPGRGARPPASSPKAADSASSPSTDPGSAEVASGENPASTPGSSATDRRAKLPEPSPAVRPDVDVDTEGDDRPDEVGRSEEHQLTDRTGRRGNLAKQLNKEFMPLAVECIDMAKERDPTLSGVLSIAINLFPIDDKKVLVASVEPQKDNEINDPELFECIEQSTLSIDGLKTRENFSITMPIAPDDSDPAEER